MGKLWKLCCSLICCMGLCACSSKPTPLNLVTRVWVTDASGSTKYYTQPQKMEVILYYLRSLEPLGKAKTDPERIIGAHYKICVEFSDGQRSVYRQRANRFLSRDSRPWEKVDLQKASVLQSLLDSMPQG